MKSRSGSLWRVIVTRQHHVRDFCCRSLTQGTKRLSLQLPEETRCAGGQRRQREGACSVTSSRDTCDSTSGVPRRGGSHSFCLGSHQIHVTLQLHAAVLLILQMKLLSYPTGACFILYVISVVVLALLCNHLKNPNALVMYGKER